MGLFSWITADTERSICCEYSGRRQFPVYMLSPDGNHIREDTYEGYGIFGGVDVYIHWMKCNHPEKCEGITNEDLGGETERGQAIRNEFFASHWDDHLKDDPEVNKYPLKFTESPSAVYEHTLESEMCPNQGYFYDEEDY
jgi:hypothetical protein